VSEPPSKPADRTSSWRKFFAALLGVYFGLVLLQTVVSALDSSCVLFFKAPFLVLPDGIILCFTLIATVVIYGLMALTPMIPKRIFIPVVLTVVSPGLIVLPAAIFYYRQLQQIDVFVSWLQVLACFFILRWLQGGWKPRWPVVADKHLGTRVFSWSNLLLFVLLNLFVFLPVAVGYVGGCTSMAVSHFTDGFVALRPGGVILQARKYVRDDGRTVVLFPMSHIAESSFYRSVEQSVTSNSVVLLEGVTDNGHLLTNHISYQRAAKAMHLSEQHEAFKLPEGRLVPADVDVSIFTSNTIAILNLVMLVHAEGVNEHTLSQMMQFAPSEEVEQQLFDDLLKKRNEHVLKELYARLPDSDSFIIPWGAAHMAGISKDIQKSGFHLVGTRNFVSIHFLGKPGDSGGDPNWVPTAGRTN
jgi:hypothetical protein